MGDNSFPTETRGGAGGTLSNRRVLNSRQPPPSGIGNNASRKYSLNLEHKQALKKRQRLYYEAPPMVMAALFVTRSAHRNKKEHSSMQRGGRAEAVKGRLEGGRQGGGRGCSEGLCEGPDGHGYLAVQVEDREWCGCNACNT